MKRCVADGGRSLSEKVAVSVGFACAEVVMEEPSLEPVTNTFVLEAMSSIVQGVWFVTVQCSSQTHKAPASRNGPNSDPTTCWLHGLDQITQVIFSAEKM